MKTTIQRYFMARSIYKFTLCVGCALWCLLIFGLNESGADQSLKLADGSMGSYWYSYATTVSELLKKKLPGIDIMITPGGGTSNISSIQQGKVDLALSISPTAYDGFEGKAPFKEKNSRIREIVALADNPLTIIVRSDSGIQSITDLKGKRLNVTPRGYTSETLARAVLKAYGMSYKDLKKVEYASNQDAIMLLKDNHIDAMVLMSGRYSSYVFDLTSSRPIGIIPLDNEKMSAMVKENPGLVKYKVPADMYKLGGDIPTITGWLHLVAGEDMKEDLVYNITKILVENIDVLRDFSKGTRDLTPAEMATDLGIPFHSGALKYYKEKGIR